MNPVPVSLPLAGWSVICLRPASQQAAVRRLVEARGARHVSLPGLRLQAIAAITELQAALACATLVFTSPAAVQFAVSLAPSLPALAPVQRAGVKRAGVKRAFDGGETVRAVFAVGAGTARALARYGIQAISPPDHAMHSEGLLALPHWQGIAGPVGLVTAPGGRGVIATGLARRGIEVRRAEVYRRLPPRLDARHRQALMQAPAPRAVLISSAEALHGAFDALPPDCRTRMLDAVAVTSSPRLSALARTLGYRRMVEGSAPTATAMLDALENAASAGFR